MKSIENILTFALGGVIVYLLVKTKTKAVQADALLNDAEENESFTEVPKVFVEKATAESESAEETKDESYEDNNRTDKTAPTLTEMEGEVIEAITPKRKRRAGNTGTVGRQRLVILDNTPFPIQQAGLGFDVDEMSDPSCGV